MRKRNTWFTLVELVVVIVIITILSTIWFIAYESYVSHSRDSKRLALLNELRDALRIYGVEYDYPLPDNKIDIQSDGVVFAYQGYMGETALETLDFSDITRDPKDDTYFTYYLSADRDAFQLLTYLENDPDELVLHTPQTHAAINYNKRYPKVFGRSLWTILDKESQHPLQEIEKYKNLGYLDVYSDSGTLLEVYVNDSNVILWDSQDLLGLVPNSTCLTVHNKNPTKNSSNGYYTINPEWDKPFLAYCDMDEWSLWHGPGWTFTTFLAANGNGSSLWDGNGEYPYRYDREESLGSYGLDLKTIYHTEAYLVIQTPDLTQEKIDTREVVNMIYDYKVPILDDNYLFPLKDGFAAMRWWFTWAYMFSHVNRWSSDGGHTRLMDRNSRLDQWIRSSVHEWIRMANESSRSDAIFYDTSIAADYTWMPDSNKAWYYVR